MKNVIDPPDEGFVQREDLNRIAQAIRRERVVRGERAAKPVPYESRGEPSGDFAEELLELEAEAREEERIITKTCDDLGVKMHEVRSPPPIHSAHR